MLHDSQSMTKLKTKKNNFNNKNLIINYTSMKNNRFIYNKIRAFKSQLSFFLLLITLILGTLFSCSKENTFNLKSIPNYSSELDYNGSVDVNISQAGIGFATNMINITQAVSHVDWTAFSIPFTCVNTLNTTHNIWLSVLDVLGAFTQKNGTEAIPASANLIGTMYMDSGVPIVSCADSHLYADDCDFDGDGVNNIDDIDDDNDGVLDIEECPVTNALSTVIFNWDSGAVAAGGPLTLESTLTIGTDDITVTATGNLESNNTSTIFQSGVLPVPPLANGILRLYFNNDYPDPIFDTNIGSLSFGDDVVIDPKLYIWADSASSEYEFSGRYTVLSNNTNGWQVNSDTTGEFTAGGIVLIQFAGKYSSIEIKALFTGLHQLGVLPAVDAVLFNCDVDLDGICNTFDLDSDADGCSDAFEAGTTADLTVDFQFSIATADVGVNGFHSSLETIDDATATYLNGGITTYTYGQAIDGTCPESCTGLYKYADNCDFDGDGVFNGVDIDDDNDGILDIEEGYEVACVNQPQIAINGASLDTSGTQGLCLFCSVSDENNVLDTSLTNFATISIPVGVDGSGYISVNLDQTYPSGTRAGFVADVNGGVVGLLTGVILKSYLNDTLQESISGGSLLNILGIGGGLNVGAVFCQPFDALRIEAGSLVGGLATYQIYYPFVDQNCSFPVACGGSPSIDPDVDNDGIENWFDLDSDGDGCYDSYEAGVIGATADGLASDSLVIVTTDTTGVGANGFANVLETNDDGIYIGIYHYNIAIDSTLNQCLDTDNDRVADIDDIDDDNDGIPDDVELITAINGGDTDGDGIQDNLDLDSDNDGIPDLIEAGGTDTDGDGQVDDACTDMSCDLDGDGLMDSVDGVDDTSNTNPTIGVAGTLLSVADADGDGQPDFQDLDADNDGINDIEEADIIDTDNNGMVDQVSSDGSLSADTDGDGFSGSLDPEDNTTPTVGDGTGTPGVTTDPDADADGQPDDDDNDGTAYNADDTDSDGTPNFQDLDSDNDGIHDVIEGGNGDLDTDGDGTIDADDTGYADTDGDGIPDPLDETPNTYSDGDISTPNEGPTDTDNDDVPDYRDLDSDNDSIEDVIEGGHEDSDGDGLVDNSNMDSDRDGIPDSADGESETFGDAENDLSDDPTDSDGDGTPDSQEIDSDNDGTNDIDDPDNPGGDPTADLDNDGVVDDTTDTDGDGIQDVVDGEPNHFGDGINTCGTGIITYAISDGFNNTSGYIWDEASTPPGDVASTQQFGVSRSNAYCEVEGWRHYYNSNEPDKILFSIEMGANTTEIEYVDIRLAELPESLYDTIATSAMFGMSRDWHVKTVGEVALTAPVNIRFYYVPLELKTILDGAIALASTEEDSPVPTAADIVWFKKDNYNPATDISADGSALTGGEGYTILTPKVIANEHGESESDNSVLGNGVNYVQFNNIAGFSGGSAFIPITGVALPVELVSFSGRTTDCDVHLNWTAASEENFSHYEVERSTNGRNFKMIEKINGSGTLSSPTNYQFTDNLASNVNYYRLRTVDLDESYEYSNVVFVDTGCERDGVTVYPNPIGKGGSVLNIDFYALKSETVIEIKDMLQRVVKRLSTDAALKEVNRVRIDVSDLPSGSYLINIRGYEGYYKFIVQE